ncbi:hypothetical protein U1Q18_048301 [Sarracenia purpurea var. burkii]
MEMAKVRSESGRCPRKLNHLALDILIVVLAKNEDEIKTLDGDEDDDLFWLSSPGVGGGNDENEFVMPELQKEFGVDENK